MTHSIYCLTRCYISVHNPLSPIQWDLCGDFEKYFTYRRRRRRCCCCIVAVVIIIIAVERNRRNRNSFTMQVQSAASMIWDPLWILKGQHNFCCGWTIRWKCFKLNYPHCYFLLYLIACQFIWSVLRSNGILWSTGEPILTVFVCVTTFHIAQNIVLNENREVMKIVGHFNHLPVNSNGPFSFVHMLEMWMIDENAWLNH